MSTILLVIHATHWLTAILLFGVALYGLKFRRRPMVVAMSAMNFLIGLWALGAAVTFSLPELSDKILANRIKMVAPSLIQLALLGLTLGLWPKKPWHKFLLIGASIVPGISLLILAHPSLHEWFITDYSILVIDGLELLKFNNGPWFKVHNISSRVIVFFCVALLLLISRNYTPKHRFRIWLVVGAIFIPLIGDTIAVHFVPMLRYVQLTPLLGFFASVIFIYALVGKHYINVVPYAKSLILDNLGDLYLVFDENNDLVDFNAVAERALQLTSHDIGASKANLARKNTTFANLLGAMSSEGREINLDDKFFEVAERCLETSGATPLGTVIVCKDITPRKRVEQSLKELNDIKSKLLAVISHDFQGNTAAELVIVQTLLANADRIPLEDRKLAYRNLESMVSQNIALIDELLEWSKNHLSAPRVGERIELSELAESTREFLKPLTSKHQVALEFGIKGANALVTDISVVRTVLRNLLSNAIKASPSGERVIVTMSASESELALLVEDRGQGIAASRIPELFQLKKGDQGGLGLFLCKEFVSTLGGKIWVDSKVGQGSRFHVSLPMYPTSACSATRSPTPARENVVTDD